MSDRGERAEARFVPPQGRRGSSAAAPTASRRSAREPPVGGSARRGLVRALVICALVASCDEGSALSDAGPPRPDAGAPRPDAGAPRPDAGAVDAGTADAGCDADEACGPGAICLEGACFDCGEGPDCDENGTPDRCDLARGTHADCNLDGVPDRCNLAGGSLDCNRSGVPDECEVLEEACVSLGTEGYVEHRAGDMPLVVSVPHGGTLRPEEVPDREDRTGSDLRTIELGEALVQALHERTGRRPHVVICHLHRDKLDANRDLAEASDGHPAAERAWAEYHGFIEAAKRAVAHQHGRGLYLDLHGLAAERDALEWGYLLNAATLLEPDARLSWSAYGHRSSLRTLAGELDVGFDALLRGWASLGTALDELGYPSVPSSTRPDPGVDPDGTPGRYFSGGYSTWRHGSRLGGPIDGVQLETNWAGVRDTADNRAAFARALAEALETFLQDRLRVPVRHPVRVELEADRIVIPGGREAQVSLLRFGAVDAPLEVALSGEGVEVGPARFAAGERRTTASVTAPSANGNGLYLVELRPGAYAMGARRRTWIRVPAVGQPALRLRPQAPTVTEGGVALVDVERFDATADLRVTPSANLDGAPVPLEGLLFSAGQATQTVQVPIEADDVPQGLRDLVVGAGGEQAELRVLDDDLDPALRAWWPSGDLRDRVAPEGRWRALGPTGPVEDLPLLTGAPAAAIEARPDYVLVADDFEVASDAGFTVAFWFRSSEQPQDGFEYLYSHGRLSSRASLNVYFTAAGTLRTALRGPGEAADYDALDIPPGPRDATWHHYALTVTPGPTARVYLDGTPAATATRGALPFDPPTHAYLGHRYDLSPDRTFSGAFADVRVYARPLTEAEVAMLAED